MSKFSTFHLLECGKNKIWSSIDRNLKEICWILYNIVLLKNLATVSLDEMNGILLIKFILYILIIFILYIISNEDLKLLSVFKLREKGKAATLDCFVFFFLIPANCSISFFCCKLFVRNIRANIFIAGEEFPAKKREPIGKQQQQIQKKLPSINEQRLRPCWIPGIIKQSNTRIHKGSPTPPLLSSLRLPFSYLLQPLSRLPLPNWEPTGRCSELVKSGLGIGIGFGPGLAFKQWGRGAWQSGGGEMRLSCLQLSTCHAFIKHDRAATPASASARAQHVWLQLHLIGAATATATGIGDCRLGTEDWGLETALRRLPAGTWNWHWGYTRVQQANAKTLIKIMKS